MTDALSDTTPPEPGRGEQVLVRLQQLLLEAEGLDDFLRSLVRLAATALPVPVHCSVTLSAENRAHPYTAAASDDLVDRFDQKQYEVNEGPCLETLRTGASHRVDDIDDEERFGAFPELAREHGLRSVFALPLAPPRQHVAGVLNMYSTEKHTFIPAVREEAVVFAGYASGALGVALRFAGEQRFSLDLQSAISSRTVIDQALGIVMVQQSCSSDRAFEILTRASQQRNVKLRDLAADLVTRVGGQPPSVRPLWPRRSPLSGERASAFRRTDEG
ncbi:GAF and ANTAR domain-containing protein [Streptomyces lincolnensis]|uniref:GAF and ANTAR domain-containing protein n=1 Tax=Streptomyces lincolnensis TaxID=1915 RepID=UPI001E3C43D3|nr:GAF and ANTAR domain-containing protein [Streptomyces lincolnensis]MCD7440404.1 GAF and ANTAR domain-containing protein [Streptomyces lincolnensis]